MANVSKTFAACGLVILAGPLCLKAAAQDYIDLEAEKANQAARSYPATSYGANSAPAGTAVAPPPRTIAPAGGQNQNLGQLFLQIQQLQQDVMRLNGLVEEQGYELRKLKEQSLERYVDLDKRLSAAAGGATVVAGSESAVDEVSPVVTPTPAGNAGQAVEQPGEGEAYRAAYALVRGQQFDDAVQAFRQFLRDYPDGKYAPNAHYWLGELYLVIEPQDLESSRQAFTLLVTTYPDNPKVPDALYKLGKVHFLKGNRERAREYLDGVIQGYADTSAAWLARDFIAENY